jgi:hypothetical protein
MVYFNTKNPSLVIFWRALEWYMLVYFMAIWYSLRQFGVFYSNLVYFAVIWCISSRFGMLLQEKSGNPDTHVFASQRWRCNSRS